MAEPITVENTLAIKPKQIAAFPEVIGAVQTDADAVDAAHGAPDGEQRGEAEQPGARHRENGTDFRCQRMHQLFRGNAQQKGDDLLRQIRVAKKAGKGRQKNQKGKDREQGSESDIARQRNSLVGEEAAQRFEAKTDDGRLLWVMDLGIADMREGSQDNTRMRAQSLAWERS